METLTQTTKVVYTASTHTSGGRERGFSESSDGHLKVKLSTPGTSGAGTNPEQLFAAGWSACFEAAIDIAARKKRIILPESTFVDAEVDLCSGKSGYFLEARLNISIPGIDRAVAEQLVEEAHQTCPYSKAIQGNVKATTTVL